MGDNKVSVFKTDTTEYFVISEVDILCILT